MFKKIIFLFFIFYILIIFQTGFLINFGLKGVFLNPVLIFIILINFLKFSSNEKIISIIFAGFFLDIFSLSQPFGFFGGYILFLLIFYFLLEVIFKKYVRLSFS